MSETKIKRICVYCGSSPGTSEIYAEVARTLGQTMAARGIGLVYGGGGIGLMGAVAQGAVAAGGKVIGIIPHALATKERALDNIVEAEVEMRVVRTMHERKAMMTKLSDAFIALPGGLGTFEELFESLTWAQLGIHRKPIGLLNVAGYFDPLLALVDRSIEEGFVIPRYRQLMVVSPEIDDLLAKLQTYQPLESIIKWVEMDET